MIKLLMLQNLIVEHQPNFLFLGEQMTSFSSYHAIFFFIVWTLSCWLSMILLPRLLDCGFWVEVTSSLILLILVANLFHFQLWLMMLNYSLLKFMVQLLTSIVVLYGLLLLIFMIFGVSLVILILFFMLRMWRVVCP